MRQCAYLDIPVNDALDLLQRTTLSDLRKLEAALVPMKRSPKAHRDCWYQYSEAHLLPYDLERNSRTDNAPIVRHCRQ